MSEYVDPTQFVITRRRKKYKFAKFHNAENCFEFDEWTKRPVDVVEIGAGSGRFSVELALLHPDKTFVALDVKADRLQKGAYDALERGIKNIYFIRARADQVSELFDEQSLDTVWVTFPDPYPKKRAAGRRLTHQHFLSQYQQLLRPTGSFCLKHDNPEFFSWSLEQLVAAKWHIEELSFDLHESELSEEYRIKTDYERRWLDEGRHTNFVRACYNRT